MTNRINACVYLRCKQDTYSTEEPTLDSYVPKVWWCGKTLGPSGPDDELADLITCQPGRACCSESIEAQP